MQTRSILSESNLWSGFRSNIFRPVRGSLEDSCDAFYKLTWGNHHWNLADLTKQTSHSVKNGQRLQVHPYVGGQSAVRKTRAQGRGLLWRGRTGVHNGTTLCINRLLRGSPRLSEHLGHPDLKVQLVEMNR